MLICEKISLSEKLELIFVNSGVVFSQISFCDGGARRWGARDQGGGPARPVPRFHGRVRLGGGTRSRRAKPYFMSLFCRAAILDGPATEQHAPRRRAKPGRLDQRHQQRGRDHRSAASIRALRDPARETSHDPAIPRASVIELRLAWVRPHRAGRVRATAPRSAPQPHRSPFGRRTM